MYCITPSMVCVRTPTVPGGIENFWLFVLDAILVHYHRSLAFSNSFSYDTIFKLRLNANIVYDGVIIRFHSTCCTFDRSSQYVRARQATRNNYLSPYQTGDCDFGTPGGGVV